MSDFDALTAARTKALDTEEAALEQRQAQLGQRELGLLGQHDAEMRPAEAVLNKTMDQPLPQREHVEMPGLPDLKKLINPKEYEGLSYALLAMAMIGGVASKGNWLGVSSTLNGALKGYMEGNKQKADAAVADYERQFKAAKEHEAQINKEYEDILSNRSMTINEQMQRIRVLSAQHGREDARLFAEQKQVDGLYRQLQAHRDSLFRVQAQHENVMARLSQQRVFHNDAQKVGGVGALNENGKAMVLALTESGNPEMLNKLSGRFGKNAAPIINMIADDMAAKGQPFTSLTVAELEVKAHQAAIRQNQVRKVAVERLAKSFENQTDNLLRLAKEAGIPSESPLLNKPIMDMTRSMSPEHVAPFLLAINEAGIVFREASTMPGSNAQMHASSQEMSEKLLSPNYGNVTLRNVVKTAKDIIGFTRQALADIDREEQATVGGLGGSNSGWTSQDESRLQDVEKRIKELKSGGKRVKFSELK